MSFEPTQGSPRPKARLDELRDAFIDPSCTLEAMQLVCGERVKDQSISALGAIVQAHHLARGLLASTLMAISGKVIAYDDVQAMREARMAAFAIGEPLCVAAILEGRYLQASALVRQELESVAALQEHAMGRRADGNVPSMSVLEPSLRRLYGSLSAAAHVAKDWIVNDATRLLGRSVDLPDDHAATRHYPEFDEQLCRRQFALHVFILTHVAAELANDAELYHGIAPSEQLHDGFSAVVQMLLAEGMLEVVDTPSA